MPGPLDGLLVITLEQAVAAPFLSSRLADAGARVIKLERAEGDFARGYDNYVHGLSSYFIWLNRGKESVAVDMKRPEDKALVERMLARADVWIQNLAPGAVERLGFGSQELRRRHPRLITVDISGYGEGVGSPYDQMKAYDMLVQAESGICSVTGPPESPSRIGVSACDVATGMFTHAGVLQALYARERTGKGSGVKGSLFASMADWMAAPIMFHEYGNRPWPRIALGHPLLVPYGAYAASDGSLTLIACQNQREWQRFCTTVLLKPDLLEDPQAKLPVDRTNNRPYVNGIIEGIIARLTREELHQRLREADVPFGSVNDVPDVAQHPALRRIEVPTSQGTVSLTAPGVYSTDEIGAYGKVPDLDEHGTAIRKEFAA